MCSITIAFGEHGEQIRVRKVKKGTEEMNNGGYALEARYIIESSSSSSRRRKGERLPHADCEL